MVSTSTEFRESYEATYINTTTKALRTSLATMLPHELLVKVFYNLEQRPQHRHTSTSSISFSSSLTLERNDILSCALVCRDWYHAAVDTLWCDVDLQSVESFIEFSKVIDHQFSYTQPTIDCTTCGKSNWDKRGSLSGHKHEYNEHNMDGDQEDSCCQECKGQKLFRTINNAPSRSHHSRSSSDLTSGSSSLSLSRSRTPGNFGYAGKTFIRSFSVAGASDCRAPRPFPFLPSCIMDQHLIAISSSLLHLTSLSLRHCVALSDMSVMQLITASSPYLRRIDLTECRLLTDLTVQLIAHLCSQLEDISLQGCGLITDDAIEQLAYYCTRLQKVNISQCSTISDKGLLTLLQSSGRMTHLDPTSKARTRNARLTKLGVAGCSGITLTGLLSIADHLTISEMGDGNHSSLVSLEFTCPALKKFSNNIQNGNISVTAATPFTTNTTSPATRFFQTLPPTLQDIIIHDSFMLSHDDMICLVDRVGPNLKTLRLDNANAIDSETITHILAVCPNLTVLCIPRATRLDDSGVIQFTKAKCSQSLVELDLSACHALTDECLTKLATSRPPVSYNGDTKSLEFSKGKCVEERATEGLCLFPNLRRLDLSYNDKLTLTGIIPLVMSLKSLCALDVSFCGDGVTRSWNSSLESIRPILDLSGSDASNQHSAVRDYGSQDEQSYESISEDDEDAPYSPPAVSSECQSVQEAVSGAVPINVPSRQGLGRYVGPLMNRSDATSRNDTAAPQDLQHCPEQGTGSNEEVQQHRRRRSSASSMSSATSSLTSYSSSCSSSSSSLSSAGSSSGSTTIESISPKRNSRRSSPYQRHRRRSPSKIILADRHDIIDSTPRRVGIPASFHLESWFTPQHQVQLQHLFQIQLQHQRDLEDQQATSAFHGAGATQGQINPKAVASLSPEMMVHPIMSAIRPGVATFSVGSLAQQRQQQRQQLQHPASAAMDMQELNENMDRHLRLEPVGHLARIGSGVIRSSISRRHHRQHYYRNHHIRRGSTGVTTGHCEISAWGLSKLRAEWSMV